MYRINIKNYIYLIIKNLKRKMSGKRSNLQLPLPPFDIVFGGNEKAQLFDLLINHHIKPTKKIKKTKREATNVGVGRWSAVEHAQFQKG
jgi:hypothetical protein